MTDVTGFRTSDLIEFWLGKNPSVQSVELVRFRQIKSKAHTGYGSPHVNATRLLKLRGQSDRLVEPDSFWDEVLAGVVQQNATVAGVLHEALLHNEPESFATISRDDYASNTVVSQTLGKTGLIGISSRITLVDGTISHLPMIDFQCRKNEVNLNNVVLIASKICGPGYVLDSGKSYHFIGTALIREAEFPSFLGKALLLSPLVDRAWIAHQLIQGSCVLRLSAKRRKFPTVIKVIG